MGRTMDWISNESVENYYREKFALIDRRKMISSKVVNDKSKKVLQSINLKEQALSESRGLITYSKKDILLISNSPDARVQPVHWNKVVSTLPAVIVRPEISS